MCSNSKRQSVVLFYHSLIVSPLSFPLILYWPCKIVESAIFSTTIALFPEIAKPTSVLLKKYPSTPGTNPTYMNVMNAVLGVHLKYLHLFLLISAAHVSQHSLLVFLDYFVRSKARGELLVSDLRPERGCRR